MESERVEVDVYWGKGMAPSLNGMRGMDLVCNEGEKDGTEAIWG